MLVWGGGGVVCEGHECLGGTCVSGIVCSATDVLGMSVTRCVGGVCEMCMCLTLCGVGGEGMSG